MPDGAKKGITVKVSAELHAEVSAYIREHGMTMSEFVAGALENELHPKISEKEGNNMANTRTVAFQVPEELFQRIKDYLQRNHMTQKQFLLGLIERELDRDQIARENAGFEHENEQDEDEPDYGENSAVDDFEGNSDEDEFEDEAKDEYDEEYPEFDDEESDPYADRVLAAPGFYRRAVQQGTGDGIVRRQTLQNGGKQRDRPCCHRYRRENQGDQ